MTETKRKYVFLGAISFIAIIAFFVMPKIYSEYNFSNALNKIKEKYGEDIVDGLTKGVLSSGYIAMCGHQNEDIEEAMVAYRSYYGRNKEKMDETERFVKKIKENDDINSKEMKVFYKYMDAKISNDIKSGSIKCNNLAKKINSGTWDY